MIQGVQTSVDNGFKVEVKTTSNRGWTPEELADRALDKLLHVSKDADEQVRAQALVFKEQIRQVLVFYMKEAIRSDRTTICAELEKQGQKELANIIRKL
jgi:membrane carboxypeptidase/penicillin-binding protein